MRETRFEWNIERDTTDTILPSQLPTQAQTVETNKEVNQKKSRYKFYPSYKKSIVLDV